MNKNIVVFMVLGLLAIAACAHHVHHPHMHRNMNLARRMDHPRMKELREMKEKFHEKMGKKYHFDDDDDDDDDDDSPFVRNRISPDSTFLDTVSFASVYYVDIEKGDSVAIHVVHTSDKYVDNSNSTISLCHLGASECVTEAKNRTASIMVPADDLSKYFKFGRTMASFTFLLEVSGKSLWRSSPAEVGIYVCVGEDVSLDTCKAPKIEVASKCVHGNASKIMDVCVCEKQFTGKYCSINASENPSWDFGSQFEEDIEGILGIVCGIISVICTTIFFCVLVIVCAGCCITCRACCCRHCKRGNVIKNGATRPPPYVANNGYLPLTAVPPPPPPPAPVHQGQFYDIPNGIEMSTLPAPTVPAAKVANPVYIMPPLAPVKQVPVFVPPPVPKN